jgi:Skp family chaperone for outer membrane proteins
MQVTINAQVHVHLASTKEVAEINQKLDRCLANQEKIMADLENEFAAFNTQLTRLLAEVNKEIQQLADAFRAGNASAQVVENARGRITAATEAAQNAADALAADNPPESA